MYLTLDQVNQLLRAPHYSLPFTESLFNYVLYRGKYNAKVYTIRFNIIPSLNENFIFNHLYTELPSRFPDISFFKASITYDLLLSDPKQVPQTYYIWRANSNEHKFDENNEIVLSNSPEAIFQFVNGCKNVDLDNLNVNFETSSVVVNIILAVVFSFVTAV
jgi:hypothetical protein